MREKLVLITGAVLFVILTVTVSVGITSPFDDAIRFPFYELRETSAAPVLITISKILHYLVSWKVIVPSCILLLILPKTRIPYGIPLSAVAITETVFFKVIKTVMQRPRPEDIVHLVSEGGWSFPSGHSITSMCLCAVIIWIVIRRYNMNIMKKTVALTLTICFSSVLILTGPSRIFLGVHYPTDVIAGWAAGLAIAALTVLIIRRFKPWRLESNVTVTSVKENAL